LEEKLSNALFALAPFVKLPKILTFSHRLFKVGLKVVKVRAIGGKDDSCAFHIGSFCEIAEEPDSLYK
jgi:hypothetical protein